MVFYCFDSTALLAVQLAIQRTRNSFDHKPKPKYCYRLVRGDDPQDSQNYYLRMYCARTLLTHSLLDSANSPLSFYVYEQSCISSAPKKSCPPSGFSTIYLQGSVTYHTLSELQISKQNPELLSIIMEL